MGAIGFRRHKYARRVLPFVCLRGALAHVRQQVALQREQTALHLRLQLGVRDSVL